MTLRYLIPLLFITASVACDPPPEDIIDGDLSFDTDTDMPESTDTLDTEIDTETDSGEGTDPDGPPPECFEAMMCIAMSPDSAFDCFAGLEEGDREAATALALCLMNGCPSDMTDLAGLAGCLFLNCPDEVVRCIGFSMF